jgi:hypothetical protein
VTVTPKEIDPGPWQHVSDGGDAFCAVGGKVECWGFNIDNSLGSSSSSGWTGPLQLQLQPTPDFTAVAHASAWDNNNAFLLAEGVAVDLENPEPLGDTTCAVDSVKGDIWCWGIFNWGPTTTANQIVHQNAPFASVYIVPDLFNPMVCGLDTDGKLWCTDTTTSTPVRQSLDTWNSVTIYSEYQANQPARMLGVDTQNTLWEGALSVTGTDAANLTQVLLVDGAEPGSVDYEWSAVGSNGALGGTTVCAIRTSGQAWCTGPDNRWGLLGEPPVVTSTPPATALTQWNAVAPFVQTQWTELAVGRDHICGLTQTGAPYCWGRNNVGQLGTGADTVQLTPIRVVLPADQTAGWTSVVAGSEHTCAVRQQDSTVWCWGANDLNELGIGQTTAGIQANAGFPVVLSSDMMADFPVQVWQNPPGGESPTMMGVQSWSMVAVGAYSSCGILSTGDLLCWGDNGVLSDFGGPFLFGESYTADTAADEGVLTSPTPIPFAAVGEPTQTGSYIVQWNSVDLTDWYVCGIAEGQTVSGGVYGNANTDLYCWGLNIVPRIGPTLFPPLGGSTLYYFTYDGAEMEYHFWMLGQPVALGTEPRGFRLDAQTKASFACAVLAGTNSSEPLPLSCWGENAPVSMTPTLAPNVTSVGGVAPLFSSVWPGDAQALDATAPAFADATSDSLHSIDGLGSYNFDSAGYSFVTSAKASEWSDLLTTCAIRSADSSLWCWGDNRLGLFANGEFGQAFSQSAAQTSTAQWQQISLGTKHGCGIQKDNSLWCWGSDDMGQLGDNAGWTFGPATPVSGG